MTGAPISRRDALAGAVATLAVGASGVALHAAPAAAQIAADVARPQCHLLPQHGWMNDPNGLVFADGRYHAFYQYAEDPAGRMPKQWGHAVSEDALHWRHLPIALAPTPGGPDKNGVFSGSAAMDGATGVIVYTGVSPETQCIARSTDGLTTWTKRAAPIIAQAPPGYGQTGFRDPHLFRHGGRWNLLVGAGQRGKGAAVLRYTSADLETWRYENVLYEEPIAEPGAANAVVRGEMFECPDFFPLGDKWALILSGRGVRCLVGDFDGARFTPTSQKRLDSGRFYAAKTLLNGKGERLCFGWLIEGRAPAEADAAGWSGVMSFPRRLSLDKDERLKSALWPGLADLRADHVRVERPPVGVDVANVAVRNLCGEVLIRAKGIFRIQFLFPDGGVFAQLSFDPRVALAGYRVPIGVDVDSLVTQMQVMIDGSVIELCVNDADCLTHRMYPKSDAPLAVRVLEGDVASIDAWRLTPISPNRMTG